MSGSEDSSSKCLNMFYILLLLLCVLRWDGETLFFFSKCFHVPWYRPVAVHGVRVCALTCVLFYEGFL